MSDNPSHYATINPHTHRLKIVFDGEVVAETERALILKEVNNRRAYDPVYYVPRADIQTELVFAGWPGGLLPAEGSREPLGSQRRRDWILLWLEL
ncbi:MAG: hypothetical protein ACI8RZ_004061 [Myxococcota bacterium]|jgi:uncharacterized protein (DUF427 family)